MITTPIEVKVSAANGMDAARIGHLVSQVTQKVESRDVIALLTKVDQNPGLVKKALKFI